MYSFPPAPRVLFSPFISEERKRQKMNVNAKDLSVVGEKRVEQARSKQAA